MGLGHGSDFSSRPPPYPAPCLVSPECHQNPVLTCFLLLVSGAFGVYNVSAASLQCARLLSLLLPAFTCVCVEEAGKHNIYSKAV